MFLKSIRRIAFLGLMIWTGCSNKPKVYFIGDSITKGYMASNWKNRWTSILCREKGWEEINFGVNGEFMDVTGKPTIQDFYKILIPLKSESDKFLFIALGTNDANYNDGVKTVNSFKRDYQKLINFAIFKKWKPKDIIIIGGYKITNFNPWGYPSNLRNQLSFIRAAKELSIKYGTRFFNLQDEMSRVKLQILSNDGVHPNDNGYAFIAEYLARELK